MTDYQKLYSGISKAAWGYFFLYFNINFNNVSILPSFVGYLLFLSVIKLLNNENIGIINNNVNKKIEELQELIENEERKKSSTSFKIKCWIHRVSVDDLGLDLKIEFLNKKLERCLNTVYVDFQ